MAAIIDPKETYRVGMATSRNTPNAVNNAQGKIANPTPASVPTPLPPLNPT